VKTVLEQLDILGGEVVPVLRKELAKNRPADVPNAPTHAARVALAAAGALPVAGGKLAAQKSEPVVSGSSFGAAATRRGA
jgi:hypothetical protein